jgi:hypothetical protein
VNAWIAAAAVLAMLAGSARAACPGEETHYRLYRSSVVIQGAAIHVATFDAPDGEAYNRENCQIAARQFQSQPGVVVTYWCERVQPR